MLVLGVLIPKLLSEPNPGTSNLTTCCSETHIQRIFPFHLCVLTGGSILTRFPHRICHPYPPPPTNPRMSGPTLLPWYSYSTNKSWHNPYSFTLCNIIIHFPLSLPELWIALVTLSPNSCILFLHKLKRPRVTPGQKLWTDIMYHLTS